jgi:hypothetical protein
MKTITLVIPGLWPFTGAALDPTAGLATPAMDLWLGRASPERIAAQTPTQWLLDHYGARGAGIAALTRPLDLPDSTGEDCHWLRADPAHLRVDRDRALLFDLRHAPPTVEESAALVASLNRLFGEDGYRFHAGPEGRWYLQLPKPFAGQTTPLADAVGQDVRPLLPQGPDALVWARFLNELQMLLYTHPVNDAREAAGQPTINTVWLWGEGHGGTLAAPPGRMLADEPLAIALAQRAGQPHAPLPARADPTTLADGDLLWIGTLQAAAEVGDAAAWQTALAALEADWIAPLVAAWQGGGWTLTLADPTLGHRYTLTPGTRWAFWRRPKPLAATLAR